MSKSGILIWLSFKSLIWEYNRGSIFVSSNLLSFVLGLIRTPPFNLVSFSSENLRAASENVISPSAILSLNLSISSLADLISSSEIFGIKRICLISISWPLILSTLRICQPKSVLKGCDISSSLRLKATSLNSFVILGFFLFKVYLPPLLLDPGSWEYKSALDAKLIPPSRISSLKSFSWSIILWFSSSETFGSITIWAISSSVPKIGKSITGILWKNRLTSSGVISTFSTIDSCIISESLWVLFISNSSSLKEISSLFL